MQEKCPEKLCLSFWFEVKWDLNPHPFAKPAKGWGTRMMVMLWRQDAGVEVLRRISQSPGDWETGAPQDDSGIFLART
jgi:hypothetical protein